MPTKIKITNEHAISIKSAISGGKINTILKFISKTSKLRILIICSIFFVIHLYVALQLKDFSWVASFGALLSVSAILLAVSELLFAEFEVEIKNIYLNEAPKHISTFGSGGFSSAIVEAEIELDHENRRKAFNAKYKNIYYFLGMSVIGALIWAYTGFLNKVFFLK